MEETSGSGFAVFYAAATAPVAAILMKVLRFMEFVSVSSLFNSVCRFMHATETRKREIRGLLEAMDTHGLKEGFIITEDEEEQMEDNGRIIYIAYAWKYLLDENYQQ